jgi:hemin uptake protein HemP
MSTASDNEPSRVPAVPPFPPPTEPAKPRDAWSSDELLGARCEVQILHNGEVYHLRRTRQGKLILYK